jgi:hypothetical protein
MASAAVSPCRFVSFADANLEFNHTHFEFSPSKTLEQRAIGVRKVG